MEQERRAEREPRERDQLLDFLESLVFGWQPSRGQVLWTLRIVIVLSVPVLVGYAYDTTLWDWLKILIVPAAISVAGIFITNTLTERARQIDEARAEEREQDAALREYFDQMRRLLVEENLRTSDPSGSVREFARARTKALLLNLGATRKRHLLVFLYEARLINSSNYIIDLYGADLRCAALQGVFLREAYLHAVKLRSADLRDAILSRADLLGADLTGATGVTKEQLEQQARFLQGATMPNGQKYEE